jgi:predicted anti-sigma-YlaC factor YlaD
MQIVVTEGSCARARRALSLLLDREAEAADVETLALHLGRCSSCRRHTAEVSAFTRGLRGLRLAPRHPDITTEAEGRFS